MGFFPQKKVILFAIANAKADFLSAESLHRLAPHSSCNQVVVAVLCASRSRAAFLRSAVFSTE